MRNLENYNSNQVHLPFWFDFELYKALFNKHYANQEEELARHDVFIKACVRTLRNRAAARSRGRLVDWHTQIDENDDRVSSRVDT